MMEPNRCTSLSVNSEPLGAGRFERVCPLTFGICDIFVTDYVNSYMANIPRMGRLTGLPMANRYANEKRASFQCVKEI
jgi:hypothetical protein